MKSNEPSLMTALINLAPTSHFVRLMLAVIDQAKQAESFAFSEWFLSQVGTPEEAQARTNWNQASAFLGGQVSIAQLYIDSLNEED